MALYPSAGTPADSLGLANDFAIDYVGRFLWGPKTTTWSGTATSLVGPTGPALLAGTGAPTNDFGTPGQAYLDVSTGNLWGPKTSSGWGSAPTTNMVGNANVVPQLRYCVGPPTSTNPSVQNDGDTAIDRQNSMLYGPRSGGVWPASPISIIGPTGPRGPQGIQGSNGVSQQLVYAGTFWNTAAVAATTYVFQHVVQSGSTVGQTPSTVPMVRAGSVTGYAVNQVGPATGNFTIIIQKNGATLATFANAGSGLKAFSNAVAAGTYTFIAGDYLNLAIQTSGSGNLQCEGYIEIQTN